MSVRSYSGPLSGRGSMRHSRWSAIPWTLAVATVLLQISYPLTSGSGRTTITILTVVVFFLASTSHALIARGVGWTLGFLAITAGGGLLVEALGDNTGFPFGHYDYADSLGVKIAGVPLIVPLAWSMMAYPAFAVARRLVQSRVGIALVGGVALAAWDLFLDPMMVSEGHWVWDLSRDDFASVAMPGIEGIPLQNFLGWLGTAVIMMALMSLLPDRVADDRQPIALWLWVYVSSILANAVFLDQPLVALIGGIAMGTVAVPLSIVLIRDRP